MSHWSDRFRAIMSVYLILTNDQNEVLLLRRQNTGYKDGELGLPAGHVDGGEDLLTAMRREAKEEVGIELKDDLQLIHVMHRNCGDHERVDYFFTANRWNGEVINTEPEKCSELVWVPFDIIPDDVIDYYKQAFEHIQAKSMFSHFGW